MTLYTCMCLVWSTPQPLRSSLGEESKKRNDESIEWIRLKDVSTCGICEISYSSKVSWLLLFYWYFHWRKKKREWGRRNSIIRMNNTRWSAPGSCSWVFSTAQLYVCMVVYACFEWWFHTYVKHLYANRLILCMPFSSLRFADIGVFESYFVFETV